MWGAPEASKYPPHSPRAPSGSLAPWHSLLLTALARLLWGQTKEAVSLKQQREREMCLLLSILKEGGGERGQGAFCHNTVRDSIKGFTEIHKDHVDGLPLVS